MKLGRSNSSRVKGGTKKRKRESENEYASDEEEVFKDIQDGLKQAVVVPIKERVLTPVETVVVIPSIPEQHVEEGGP